MIEKILAITHEQFAKNQQNFIDAYKKADLAYEAYRNKVLLSQRQKEEGSK